MKKLIALSIIIPLFAITPGFIPKKRSQQQGPGLGNLSYNTNELFKPIGVMSALNGAPLGHGHAMMFKGYLAMILAHDSGKKGGGFGFYDVSNPRNPQSVFYKVDASTEKIREGHGFGFFRVNGRDYCALQTISGIQIWDWTDVTAPVLASDLTLPGVLESDYASGSWWVATQAPYLYVSGSSNGFYIVDASNPAAPVLVRQVPTTQTGSFRVGPIFAVGNLLVIASMDALGMATLNISDPTSPSLLDTDLGLETFTYSSMVNGNYILGAGKDNRIHLWDISDPANLHHIASTPVMGGGGGYVNYQDGFVHAGMSDNYAKADIRDLANITVVGTATSGIPDTDHDFGNALGNLVLVGNDHGSGSALIVHDVNPDMTPPAVTRVIPAPDALLQPVSTRIGITMSDGIEYSTINEETFIVRPFGGQPLEGTYSYQFGILNFTPKNYLDPNKLYEIVLTKGGVKDYAGNAMEHEFISKFSTGSTLTPIACSLQESPFVELTFPSFFEVTPFNNNPATTTYAWDFGDGSPVVPTTSSRINHTYSRVGRYTVLVTISDGNSQSTCNISHTVHEKVSGKGPSQATTVILDASGNTVWNVNPDNNTLTKTDVSSLSYVKEIATGKTPVSVAQDSTGNIWVLNKGDASIQIFDNSGNLSETIPLPHGSLPFAMVISPNKQKAYVSLHARGEVLKIDVTSRAVEAAKQVCAFPKGLAVSPDNRQLFVTRFITENDSGEVYMLNVANLDVMKIIKLAPDQSTDSEFGGKGVANYLNSITLSPNGRIAVVPAKKDNIYRGLQRDGNMLNFENTVRPMLGLINLVTREEDYDARIDINNGDIPTFTIFSKYGNLIFASLQGNDRVDVFDAYNGSFLNSIENAGSAPQGLTLSRTGDTLFVHSFLSRTISAYNIHEIVNQISSDIVKLGEIAVVKNETMDAIVLKGKKIFYNANDERMNKDSYMSCATCHLDGDNDGRVWDLTQLGEGIRNTIPLNGRGGAAKGAVHWTGNFDEIQDFEGQIRKLAGGKGFMHDADFNLGEHSKPLGDTKAGLSEDLDALAAYISSLDKFDDSPYRNADGSLTEAGERGKQVFANNNCGLCHSGPDFSDSKAGLFHDVGSIKASSGKRLEKPLLGFDCPTLKGLWLSPPYLHDGSAKTLQDALASDDGTTHHADLARLTRQQMDDLIAYLMQLDDREVSTYPFMELKLTSPENHSLFDRNETTTVKLETNLQQVTEVRYYIDGNEFMRRTDIEPVSYMLTSAGSHTIQAKVYHSGGKLASLTSEIKVIVLEEECDFEVKLQPNPVSGTLRIITVTGNTDNGINSSHLRLFDVSGKKLLDETMRNTSGAMDFSSLARGVYFLVMEKDGCRKVEKVLKQE